MPSRCGEQRKPRVNCIGMGTSMARTPVPQNQGNGTRPSLYGSDSEGWQSLPSSSASVKVESAKSSRCSFLHPDVYSLKLLACRDPLLRPAKSWPCPVHNRLVVPGSHVVVLPHQSSHSPAQLFCLCVCPFFAPSQPQSCFLAQAVLDHIGYRDVYTTC